MAVCVVILIGIGCVALSEDNPGNVPGFGVAFFNNAPPLVSPTVGSINGEQEWRPIFVNNKPGFAMPEPRDLNYALYSDVNTARKGQYKHSAYSWEAGLPSVLPWPGQDLFILGKGPSTVWRRYGQTLYYQVNQSPIVLPLEFSLPPQVVMPDMFGTLSKTEWNSSSIGGYAGLPNAGSWGVFNDVATFWHDQPAGNAGGTGAKLGTLGVGLFVGFLIVECFATIEYDNLVRALNAQALKLYHASLLPQAQAPAYFSLRDPGLNQPVILERDIPNYSAPAGIDSNDLVAPSSNAVGGFTMRSGEATSSTFSLEQGFQHAGKLVTINKAFTSASIPFQFVLRVNTDDAGNATHKIKGRFYLRVLLPAIAGDPSTPARWVDLDVAGIKNWLQEPSELIPNATTFDGGLLDTGSYEQLSYADEGTQDLLVAWSGEVILRALDFGVDRFEKVQFGLEADSILDEYNIDEISSNVFTTSDATLTVQPLFSRNLAEAGPWKETTTGNAVLFRPDASFLPSNTTDATYTWDFGDETPLETSTVTNWQDASQDEQEPSVQHAFAMPGTYTVSLKVDPNVPNDAENRALFNSEYWGFSYDICKVHVTPGTDLPEGESPPDCIVCSNVQFEPGLQEIIVRWYTNWPTTSLVQWLPCDPNFVGPPAPAGNDRENRFTWDHEVTVDRSFPHTDDWCLKIGGRVWGAEEAGYVYAEACVYAEPSQEYESIRGGTYWWQVPVQLEEGHPQGSRGDEADSTQGSERTVWNLPQDFSSGQGVNNWYYYRRSSGAYVELSWDSNISPWGNQSYSSWNGGARFLWITGPPQAAAIQTGEGSDTAIGWQAPRTGTVSIAATMTAVSVGREYTSWCGPKCDDGIYFSIRKGSGIIAGPAHVLHGNVDQQRQTLYVTTAVEAGDFIYFYQARGNWQDVDAAYYNFTITYLEESR